MPSVIEVTLNKERGVSFLKTKDIDIRLALRESDDIKKLCLDDYRTRVIEELGLSRGQSRIDVAVINGHFYGYEIKSDKDNLERLPQQVIEYNKVFDYISIVCGEAHSDKVSDLIPEWWGIIEAFSDENDKVLLSEKRERQANTNQDPFTIAQLLWKDEALGILINLGKEKGVKSKSCKFIWQRLTEVLSLPELKDKVRDALKSRENWRKNL